MTIFQLFYEMKLKTSKSCHFEANKDIMTKFKSQALHIIIIKYWNASVSGNPPSFIPALWNIGILLQKQATHAKQFELKCIYVCQVIILYVDCTKGSFVPQRELHRRNIYLKSASKANN